MRRIVGITGCPGAGKSTLAARTAARLGETAVVVPMDGFHLARSELARSGRADRRGAPDTFDVDGFVAVLTRIRSADRTVYAPTFDRHLDDAIAGAIAVEEHHRVVITEGNYLLYDRDGWERVAPLLDECWYVEVDDDLRRRELAARHVAHGRSADAALAWVRDVDDANAELVRRTRHRADRIVTRDGADVDASPRTAATPDR